MSHWRRDLREFIWPGSVRRKAIPPLEAGLRPNTRLDAAEVIETFESTVADVATLGGDIVVGVGREVFTLTADGSRRLVELAGEIRAMASRSDYLMVAVHGIGIVRVDAQGGTEVLATDQRLTACVTSLATLGDGTVLVTIGSTETDEWARNLVAKNSATGLLLKVDADGSVGELARDLAWPAGVHVEDDGHVLLSLSAAHRVERRSLAEPGRRGTAVLDNLPAYPGRIAPGSEPGQWWLALPYLRNRATELILEDEDVLAEMVGTTEPEAWLVPTLRIENIYRTPLQTGSVRVLGEIKPWAPTRTYGLVALFNGEGRILESAHSRADGRMHGVTAVIEPEPGSVIVASSGANTILRLGDEW